MDKIPDAKFKVLQTVYTIEDGMVVEKIVWGIHSQYKTDYTTILKKNRVVFMTWLYSFNKDSRSYGWVAENKIFSTRKGLIMSL